MVFQVAPLDHPARTTRADHLCLVRTGRGLGPRGSCAGCDLSAERVPAHHRGYRTSPSTAISAADKEVNRLGHRCWILSLSQRATRLAPAEPIPSRTTAPSHHLWHKRRWCLLQRRRDDLLTKKRPRGRCRMRLVRRESSARPGRYYK